MSNRNDGFFKEKKNWSRVKDELLTYYLEPYTQKILFTHKPLVYIDCFAGKGKFEDGENGSPLIALDIIKKCKTRTQATFTDISTYFIDLNYKEDLEKNLRNYKEVNIISGKFEDEIIHLLKDKNDCNIFLYIDPYGISALQHSLFENFSKRNFYSIELLINLNSFGFVREGCHVLGLDFTLPERNFFDDLLEYDSTILDRNLESKRRLTEIAGGEYWIDIIDNYKNGVIDGYKAEEEFTKQYCIRLMQHYKYVLNIPVKITRTGHPKYRMVHVTNHPDGCLIMVDNMYNKWQILQGIQNKGQGTLFGEDFENQIIDEKIIVDALNVHLSKYKQDVDIEQFIAEYFTTFGVFCSSKEVRSAIKELESQNKIIVTREPAFTLTGKETTFMVSNRSQTVYIRGII